mgnify:CR=1 FL=1
MRPKAPRKGREPAGLALLMSYASGWGFGLIFFLVNLPFYILAVKRMGWGFTIRTFTAVALVSILSKLNGAWIDFSHLDPLYATIIGGGLIGTGLLAASISSHFTCRKSSVFGPDTCNSASIWQSSPRPFSSCRQTALPIPCWALRSRT